MSDLVDRLRRWAADAPPWIAMPYAGEAADRIETLEARLDRAVTRGLEQVEQIATLEAALREIKDQYLTPEQSSAIARKALRPEFTTKRH